MTPLYWNEAKNHLSAACPVMNQLITRYEGEGLRARGDGFYTLLRSVIGQQISVKAADAVWAKVEKAVQPLTPKKLLLLSDEQLRACGLSASKVAYSRNVAEFFNKWGIGVGKKEVVYWAALSDDEVIAQLTSIKGIGIWTAEMFLIFHLLRPNVFPVKDLGVLKAIHVHYGDWVVEVARVSEKHLKKPLKPSRNDVKNTKNASKNLQSALKSHQKTEKWLPPAHYIALAERWEPYRTVATWYLWRALDPVPVAY